MPIAERRAGFRPGLRLKLLLAASILLLIPLLGYLYVRELEHLLLKVQEQGVISTARAVGTALNDRPSLFRSGEVYPFALAQENDLKIDNLPAAIAVDGQTEDWDREPVSPHSVGAGVGSPESRAYSARFRIGRYGNAIYALFEVSDPKVVLRDPDQDGLQTSDRLEIAVVTPDDEFLRFSLDARGSGRASVYLLMSDDEQVPDTRIYGVFRLVLQPVYGAPPKVEDVALHAFFGVPRAEVPQVVDELRALAAQQDLPRAAALQVNKLPSEHHHPSAARGRRGHRARVPRRDLPLAALRPEAAGHPERALPHPARARLLRRRPAHLTAGDQRDRPRPERARAAQPRALRFLAAR